MQESRARWQHAAKALSVCIALLASASAGHALGPAAARYGAESDVPAAEMTRVKDVAAIEGIRNNQLVGFGLVVGLREPATAHRPSFLRRL